MAEFEKKKAVFSSVRAAKESPNQSLYFDTLLYGNHVWKCN
jgi:hypothetical protein